MCRTFYYLYHQKYALLIQQLLYVRYIYLVYHPTIQQISLSVHVL